jgi:hypothetical protein
MIVARTICLSNFSIIFLSVCGEHSLIGVRTICQYILNIPKKALVCLSVGTLFVRVKITF